MFLFALHPAFAEAPDLTGLRHAAIHFLEQRVRATPRPGELLRLAELWQQDAEALELAAFADQVARFDRCHDTPGCDPSTILVDLSAANRAREHATARYLRLLRDFPTAAEADDAAYGLGWAWRAMGEAALGERVSASNRAGPAALHRPRRSFPSGRAHPGAGLGARRGARGPGRQRRGGGAVPRPGRFGSGRTVRA